ncbi:hypothetical protein L810_3763 [Burkholderia sp. AU4i]|nr:hypothetical protein L810_3763 [Burkholderia sp. AU4i]
MRRKRVPAQPHWPPAGPCPWSGTTGRECRRTPAGVRHDRRA